MRTYKVTLTNGSWAEIDHPGDVTRLAKEIRRHPTIRDNHGRLIFTNHIVTVGLRGRVRSRGR